MRTNRAAACMTALILRAAAATGRRRFRATSSFCVTPYPLPRYPGQRRCLAGKKTKKSRTGPSAGLRFAPPPPSNGAPADVPSLSLPSDPRSLLRTDLSDLPEGLGPPPRAPPRLADPSGISRAEPGDVLDLSTLYDPSIHLPDRPDFASPEGNYEPGTPLADDLVRIIGVGGPITVAEYMRMALRHPTLGYYTSGGMAKDDLEDIFDDDDVDGGAGEDDDGWELDDDDDVSNDDPAATRVIGPRGDFTTAPEISQIFGESLTVWYLTQYEAMGCPPAVRLVEIGPGRGTLASDVMRTILTGGEGSGATGSSAFQRFASALAEGGGLHLVEVGKGLRNEQRGRLEELFSADGGLGGYGLDIVRDKDASHEGGEEEEVAADAKNEDGPPHEKCISVRWHDDVADVPESLEGGEGDEPIPTFFICQEIVDALPVHQFQKTSDGWRERLVDVAVREGTPAHVRGGQLAASCSVPSDGEGRPRPGYSDAEGAPAANSGVVPNKAEKTPRFRFVLPPDTTPALRSLLHVDPKTGRMEGAHASELDSHPVGQVMEVCPEGMILAQQIASRLERCGGGALIIDYGGEGSRDTLRAFRSHRQAHPLSSPGAVDVTADVDFAALREAVNNRRKEGEAVGVANAPMAFGPVTQGKFLMEMGAADRVVALIERDGTTDEQAEDLCNALERLVDPEHMGERYKVMAIARKKDDIFNPPGF